MSREPLSSAKPSANLGAQAWKGVGAEGRGAASLGTLLARKNRTSYDLPPSQEGSSRAEDSKRVNFIAWVNRQWKFVRVHSGITDESQIARYQKISTSYPQEQAKAEKEIQAAREKLQLEMQKVEKQKEGEAKLSTGEVWWSLAHESSTYCRVLSIVLHGSVIYKSISTILTASCLCVCVLSTHEG